MLILILIVLCVPNWQMGIRFSRRHREGQGRVEITTDHSFLCFSLQNPPKPSYTVRGVIRPQCLHGTSGLPAPGLVGGPFSRP